MARTGRPKGSGSLYTEEKANAICDRLAEGEPLRQICRDIGLGWGTPYNWINEHPTFAERFAQARARGFDAIAADCQIIADTPLEGIITTEKPDGTVEVKREDMLGHRKLQIETRLKLLAKWDPKRYGEKIEHTGDFTLKRQAADLTDDELATIAAQKSLGST